jgi:hemoglobin
MAEQPSLPSPYERLGGETRVRELVDRFYDYMDSLDEAQGIRSLHAQSLRGSRRKLFLFLSGWLGGPDLYVQAYGHPRLRARHLPFPIGQAERDQWMLCMTKALEDMNLEDSFKNELQSIFWRTADHMRNKPEQDDDHRLRIFPGAVS